MPLLKVNYIFNECCFKIMSQLIWINATVLEMLLSYFVFHQDKLDASFCHRMFHPPLLASNCFLFCLCLNRDIYSTCCLANLNVTPATLLDFSATAQNKIGFPIYVCKFVRDLVCVMTCWYLPSSKWSCSVFWDVVLLVLVLF